MGLTDTIALFGAAVLAAPIALLGAEFLLGGRPLAGAAFLVVAGGVVAGVYYRPTVKGVAVDLLGSAVPGDDAEDEDRAPEGR
jgi:hypothetical protein